MKKIIDQLKLFTPKMPVNKHNKITLRIRNSLGFTLMEIMTVIVIIAIIIAFAVPNYLKAIDRSHYRDAILQLQTLHAANDIYKAQNVAYLDSSGANYTVGVINSGLGLNLIENGLTYIYNAPAGAATYTATATSQTTSCAFVVTLTEAVLSSTNPQCTTNCTCF